MGVTPTDQPPQILWPQAGMRDVAPPFVVLARGGTVALHATPPGSAASGPFAFAFAGKIVAADVDLVGTDEYASPHGIETIPTFAIRSRVPPPAHVEVELLHRHPTFGPYSLVTFHTGEHAPPPSTPRRVEARVATGVPVGGPPGPAPPHLGLSAGGPVVIESFAIELGPGAWVVRTRGGAATTAVAVGPTVHQGGAVLDASGNARVDVLDANLAVALAFDVRARS